MVRTPSIYSIEKYNAMHLLLHQSSASQLTPPVYHARTRYSKASERLFIKSDREPIIDEAIEALLFWLPCLRRCSTSMAFNFALSTTTTFVDTTTTSHIFAPILPSACLHSLYWPVSAILTKKYDVPDNY